MNMWQAQAKIKYSSSVLICFNFLHVLDYLLVEGFSLTSCLQSMVLRVWVYFIDISRSTQKLSNKNIIQINVVNIVMIFYHTNPHLWVQTHFRQQVVSRFESGASAGRFGRALWPAAQGPWASIISLIECHTKVKWTMDNCYKYFTSNRSILSSTTVCQQFNQ